MQRGPADSHGKPCTLVSVFGNLDVECSPCLLPVRLCNQLKETLLTAMPKLFFFFLKIWSANISVHLPCVTKQNVFMWNDVDTDFKSLPQFAPNSMEADITAREI